MNDFIILKYDSKMSILKMDAHWPRDIDYKVAMLFIYLYLIVPKIFVLGLGTIGRL